MSDALEKDLVGDIRRCAKAMNVMLAEVGQYKAKSSGTTIGFPDLVVICAGNVQFIETKRAKGGVLSIGQHEFIRRAAEQGVGVKVITTVEEFVDSVNAMRRRS